MSSGTWSRRLNTWRAQVWFMVLVPLACGLLSLAYGTDANWDLFHTHLYNPYAWLNARLDTDLAPAGLQSYFNPLLDVPYYWMSLHWPAPLVGFLMGAVQGLNFVLLLGIAHRALPGLAEEDRWRLPLLLALAGCLTANFLSVLGNSMGDATTALFVLAALYLILRNWEPLQSGDRRSWMLLLAAGGLAGLATGLKLTNAVYALAFCLAFFTLPLTWTSRLRITFLFGIGVLLGLGLTGGYWFWDMWQRFHNPLFPMFSALFPNPLARPIGVADASWQPKGLVETLLWPFIFTWDSHRVGQVHLRQFIWALLYLLFWWWAVRALWRRFRLKQQETADSRALFLIAGVALGYFIWMQLFSIYRYLVPIELLAPLLVFILLRELLPYERARRHSAWALTASALVVVLGGVSTWGHEPWAEDMYRVQAPQLAQPDRTTVIMAGTEAPLTWLGVFLPEQLSFVGLSEAFPESKFYVQKARSIAAERGGPIYVLVAAHTNWRAATVTKAERWADRLGLTQGVHGCATLAWLTAHLHLHAGVQTGEGGTCHLSLLPEDQEDSAAEDRASAEASARLLKQYDYVLDVRSCTLQQASVGATPYPYQWCRVEDAENGPANGQGR